MSDQCATSLQEFVISTLAAASKIDPQDISEDTSLLDLAIDSITLVGVIAQIEMRYSCEVPVDQMYEVFDAPFVRDIVAIVGRFVTTT